MYYQYVLQVSECGWNQRKAPTLQMLFSICKNMHLWLRQSSKNVCVVHCMVSPSLFILTTLQDVDTILLILHDTIFFLLCLMYSFPFSRMVRPSPPRPPPPLSATVVCLTMLMPHCICSPSAETSTHVYLHHKNGMSK